MPALEGRVAAPIKSITIVGGGTSGWLSALFFATRFAREVEMGLMRIALIESPRIPIIGVGESLSPSMPETLKSLRISEREFFREAEATFKVAGYFLDWERPAAEGGSSWINPFVGYLTAGYEFERFEIKRADGRPAADYAATISPCRSAIEQGLGPRRLGDAEYSSVLRYAYHIDASKFALLLRRHAIDRGVTHVLADVQGVKLDERGHVATLLLEGQEPWPVELVIDASGFSSIVLHRGLGVPLVDYGDYLLNDRAAVIQIDTDTNAPIEPATRSTAIDAGWCFRVPLATRAGNGYIFSSKVTDDETAARQFAAHLGDPQIEKQLRFIKMRVGRAARAWEKNCIGVGLAAGFVEPLESSAIYSVETTLKWIYNYFPDSDFAPVLAKRYNDRTEAFYDEVVEYIALHYRRSQRTDSEYWRIQREEMRIPDRLRENLELWRETLPVRADVLPTNYFDHNTYTAALFGTGFYPGASLKPGRVIDRGEWENTKAMIEQTHRGALAGLPKHRALVERLRQ